MRRRLHLTHPPHPAWLVAGGALLAGVALLAAAVTTSATVVHLDAALGRAARVALSGISHHLDFEISALAGTRVAMPLTAAAVLVLCLLRQWRGALALALSVLSTQAVVDLIKVGVDRPRPGMNEAIANASGTSFPSAHSATGMALYAMLGLLAARSLRGPARFALAGICATVVAAVGLSRILLAAHYPIDVLAGWSIGGALVLASWLLVTRLRLTRSAAGAS
jgi:membrane-associated phospholipid phosphatase